MVVTEENVRRLSRYAAISEEEARAALDAAGGDALEALALLERQGRIRRGPRPVGPQCPGSPRCSPVRSGGTGAGARGPRSPLADGKPAGVPEGGAVL